MSYTPTCRKKSMVNQMNELPVTGWRIVKSSVNCQQGAAITKGLIISIIGIIIQGPFSCFRCCISINWSQIVRFAICCYGKEVGEVPSVYCSLVGTLHQQGRATVETRTAIHWLCHAKIHSSFPFATRSLFLFYELLQSILLLFGGWVCAGWLAHNFYEEIRMEKHEMGWTNFNINLSVKTIYCGATHHRESVGWRYSISDDDNEFAKVNPKPAANNKSMLS